MPLRHERASRASSPALTLAASCAAALSCLLPAQAQIPRPDAGSSLQQQGQQPLAIPRAAPPVLPPEFAPKPALQASPSLSVAVQGFTFSGNTAFSAGQLMPRVADLAGRQLTLAQLNEAADRVRQFYRERGYFVAQAYLPRQDITSGTVEITVLEGYLGQAKAAREATGAGRLRESFAQGVLDAHLAPGQLITEAALEQPLLLLNDLPGVQVSSSLGAGARVGTADVDVALGRPAPQGPLARATEGLVTGSADLDNQGNRFTGQWRAGVSLNLNNATGYGDQLSARVQAALNNRHANFSRVAWQTPVGYYGTQAGVAYARLNYTLIKDFAPLRAEGDAGIQSLFASQPLLRTRNANLSLLAGYDKKDIEDRTLAVNNTETRRITVTRVSLQGDWRDSVLGGGLNTFSLAYASGNTRIAQAAAAAADQGVFGAGTLGRFGKTGIEALRLQRVTDEIDVLGSITAQFASRNLSSSEKMSLGGPNGGTGVRAYPIGEAAGDEGYTGTLEARYTHPAWRIANAATVLAAFYDFGRVTLSKNPLPGLPNSRSLQGAGLSLSVGKPDDFLLRSSIAWRLGNELPLSDTDRSPRFWLQAVKYF